MAKAAEWIKLTTNMFEDDKIDMILKMPDGDALVLIWVRLITMAGKSNAHGYILLSEDIPYDAAMLASKCNKSMQVINYALTTFEKFKMIELNENGILIKNFDKHQDLDKLNHQRELAKLRKQKQRESEKLLLEAAKKEMSRVTKSDKGCDIERDPSYSYSNIYNSNIIYNNSKNCAKNDEYVKFFSENFHLITPYEFQILKSFEDDGLSADVIKLALVEAIENNVREIRYVKKVLNNWLEKGLNTVEKVKADKKEFERNKQSKNKIEAQVRYKEFELDEEVL